MRKFTAKSPNVTKENDWEKAFRWYCEELLEAGFLKRYDREPESFLVIQDRYHSREKHFKRKQNETESFVLSSRLTYTYDFRLIWDEKALHLFTDVFEVNGVFKYGIPLFVSHWMDINGEVELVSYVDVKPHFAAAQFGGGKMSSFYTFPIIQKILLHLHNLYVNKIIPINSGKHGRSTNLFATSFVPNRYLFTDSGTQLRKIPFKKTSLSEFVNSRQTMIEGMKEDERAKEKKPPKQGELF